MVVLSCVVSTRHVKEHTKRSFIQHKIHQLTCLCLYYKVMDTDVSMHEYQSSIRFWLLSSREQ